MRSICGENLSVRIFQRRYVANRHLSSEGFSKAVVFFASHKRMEAFFRRFQKPRLKVFLQDFLRTNVKIYSEKKEEFPMQRSITTVCKNTNGFDWLKCVFYVFVFMFYQKSSDPDASIYKRNNIKEVDVDHFCLRVPLSFCLYTLCLQTKGSI